MIRKFGSTLSNPPAAVPAVTTKQRLRPVAIATPQHNSTYSTAPLRSHKLAQPNESLCLKDPAKVEHMPPVFDVEGDKLATFDELLEKCKQRAAARQALKPSPKVNYCKHFLGPNTKETWKGNKEPVFLLW